MDYVRPMTALEFHRAFGEAPVKESTQPTDRDSSVQFASLEEEREAVRRRLDDCQTQVELIVFLRKHYHPSDPQFKRYTAEIDRVYQQMIRLEDLLSQI